MNLMQLSWAFLIIHNIHRASEKEGNGTFWMVMAVLAMTLDLFLN